LSISQSSTGGGSSAGRGSLFPFILPGKNLGKGGLGPFLPGRKLNQNSYSFPEFLKALEKEFFLTKRNYFWGYKGLLVPESWEGFWKKLPKKELDQRIRKEEGNLPNFLILNPPKIYSPNLFQGFGETQGGNKVYQPRFRGFQH